MKRDMDLIRAILLRAEEDGDYSKLLCTREEFASHVVMLKEAGLVEAAIHFTRDRGDKHPNVAHISRLTWAGHEFLDSARDDTMWRKAKEHVLKPGAFWTLGLLVEYLRTEARRRFFGDDG